MPDRLKGKRVVVADAQQFMGPETVALFREEGAEVIADGWCDQPAASDARDEECLKPSVT
jgi:hypothetical protein